MKPALVILAAGESRRLGACKALVDLGGRTALARLLEAGRELDDAPPLVVTGAHHQAIRAALPDEVEVLFNPDWAAGRTSGVALASLARPGLDLAIAPVDVPLVPAEVFEDLLDEWLHQGSPARGWLGPYVASGPSSAPVVRFGHPVFVGRELLLELRRTGKDFPVLPDENPIHTLRDLRLFASETISIEVGSARILDDLDTPEDLERLRMLVS